MTDKRNVGGRPVKITPEVRAKLLELLALGLSYRRACAVLRFSYPTLQNYREKHPDFQDEIDCAVAKSIERSIRRIERAAENGDVACDRWLLERRFPAEWGRSRVEISGLDGQPMLGAVQIFLPAKDAVNGAPPAVTVETTKELANGD